MLACMDNVIFLRAFQTRLPRRLINDGWWLEERHPAATGRRTGAFPRPAHNRCSFTLNAITQPPEWRNWSFRAWRLKRYLANNPEATQDGKKG